MTRFALETYGASITDEPLVDVMPDLPKEGSSNGKVAEDLLEAAE